MLRYGALRSARVKAARCKFLGVFMVVFANAKYVPARLRNGRFQRDFAQGDRVERCRHLVALYESKQARFRVFHREVKRGYCLSLLVDKTNAALATNVESCNSQTVLPNYTNIKIGSITAMIA
jgi:hypothetical protein